MKYRVIVHNKAVHYLDKLTGFQQEKIKQSLKELMPGLLLSIIDANSFRLLFEENKIWF